MNKIPIFERVCMTINNADISINGRCIDSLEADALERLIKYFETLKPLSRPCTGDRCPATVAFRLEDHPEAGMMGDLGPNGVATDIVPIFASVVDEYCAIRYKKHYAWDKLRATEIIRIAKAIRYAFKTRETVNVKVI